MSLLLNAEDITVDIAGRKILKAVSFQLIRGQMMALTGPNGSGKSTLIKVIIGSVKKNSGKIVINTQGRCIGYASQDLPNDRFFPATAYEIIENGVLLSKKQDAKEQKYDITKLIDILNLHGFIHNSFSSLSGGQKRRVLLARALAVSSELLLLDEPTTGLDPESVTAFYESLCTIRRQFNTAVLMVSHDLPRIFTYTDNVLYLEHSVKFLGSSHDFEKSVLCTQMKEHQI